MSMESNQFELLALIQKAPGIAFTDLVNRAKAKRLFEKVGEDVSTISSDSYRKRVERSLQAILDLTDPVIPLEKTNGKPVHYRLPEGFKLPPSQLDISLAMFLKLAKSVFTPILPSAHQEMMNAYFDASDSLFNTNSVQTKYRNFLSKIAWHPEGYGNRLVKDVKCVVAPTTIEALAEAIFENRTLSLSYENRYRDADTTYLTQPLGLVLRGNVIYLVCKLIEANKEPRIRHLHTGRIYQIETAEPLEIVTTDFNLANYIESGAFERDSAINEQPVDISLWVEPYLKTIFLERMPEVGIKEDDGGNVYVNFTETPHPEFIWWLLGFGSQITVLEPASLVERVKSEISAMFDNYE